MRMARAAFMSAVSCPSVNHSTTGVMRRRAFVAFSWRRVQSSQARRGAQLPRSRLLRTSDGECPSQAFLGIGQGCWHVCDRACEQNITSDAVQIGSPTILSRFSNTLERFDHGLQRLIMVAGCRQSLRQEPERPCSP